MSTKYVVLTAINETSETCSGFDYGESSIEELQSFVELIPCREDKYINLAMLCQYLNQQRTMRIPANDNQALDFIIRECDNRRVMLLPQ